METCFLNCVPQRNCAVVMAVILTVLSGLIPSAAAQTSQPTSGPTTRPIFVYSEPSFGFEITLPALWSYDRTRFTAPAGSLGLMRGRSVGERATLQICISRGLSAPNFKIWLRKFENALTASAALKRVDRSDLDVEGRRGVILEYDEEAEGEVHKSFYYCVAMDPDTVWMMVFAGALPLNTDATVVRDQLRDMIGTLHFTASAEDQALFSDALDDGAKLLAELPKRGPELQLDGDTHYYEMVLKGQSIGYFTRRMSRESMSLDDPRFGGNRKEGVHVHEQTWRFDEDGGGRFIRVDLFASFDLLSELIESEESVLPPKSGAAPLVITTTDRVIREGETLFSSVMTNLDAKLPDPRTPLRISPAYLGLAWTRVLPLLTNNTQDACAFSVYDSATRGFLSHVIQPIGRAPLPDNKDVSAIVAETREAFSTTSTRVFCDDRGNALRVESGDLVLKETTAKEIDRKFGALRKETDERIRKYSKPFDWHKPLGR